MRVETFGELAVVDSGGARLSPGGGLQATAFAVLCVSPSESVSLGSLAEALWGAEPPERYARSLATFMSSLRKQLKVDIESTSSGYQLNIDRASVDTAAFADLVRRPDTSVEELRSTLEMWTGEPFAGLDAHGFFRDERVRLGELRLAGVRTLAREEIDHGLADLVVRELSELIDMFPYDEQLRGLHMEALFRVGRQAEALRSYSEFRERLVAELGIEPSPELQEIELAVLNQTLPGSAGPAAGQRGVRVHQLLHPALRSEFAAVGALNYRSNNLPIQLSSFVGRRGDIEVLVGALSDARLLTVTGVGGSGKTRLALQAVAEVLVDYPAGVWLVELADVVDPELVLSAVAVELGVTERQGWSLIESVAASIGYQQLLLLLDICELLVTPAAVAAAGLLERCPNLRILATSRELLGVPGEVPFAVQPLSVPPAEGTRDVIESFDAVRLFVERATTAKPGFVVTSSNANDIARICRRLDGMPLALELAAARVRVMSPEQISTHLDDQFSLLTGGARTALPRQRTLHATIEWSYQLLNEDEQAVFQSVSVFVGGFAPEGAEQVAGTDHITGFAVTDLVHRMVDKSLVMAGEEPDGSTRYRLLETIRQFSADELVKSGRANDVRRRHARAFAALVIEQEELLQADGGGVDALTVEHDNIRAALRWSLDVGDVDIVTDIAAPMGRYWVRRDLSLEGRDWLLEVLDLIPKTDTPTRATILRVLGWMLYWTGSYDMAQDQAEQALNMARRLDDDTSRIGALNTLAVIADGTGEYEAERAYLEEGLDLVADSDHRARSIFIADLGWAAWKSDDMQTARRQFNLSLEEAERGKHTSIDDALFGLAWVTWVEGDFARAEELATEAIALADQSGQPVTSAGYGFGVAVYAHDGGNHAAVESALANTLPILLESRDDQKLNHWLWAAARAQPELSAAVHIMGAQAALAERTGFVFGIPIRHDIERLRERARTELGLESFDRARMEGQAASVDQASATALEGLAGRNVKEADTPLR
jgi:predicted ATPase/DNA-binding SARP family transcriptional activator